MRNSRLGVVLRFPFKPDDPTHRVLQSIDHVLIYDQLLLHIEKVAMDTLSLGVRYSVFVSTASKTPKFLSTLHDDFFNYMAIDTVFLEVNPLLDGDFQATREFVTNLLKLRPEKRIGIVSSYYSWDSKNFDSLAGLGKVSQVFPCPFVGHFVEIKELPVGCTPFVLSVSPEEHNEFSRILSDSADMFPLVVFWRPGLLESIEIKEILMEETKPKVGQEFTALFASTRREMPSLSAKGKGTLMVGEAYVSCEFFNGPMSTRFGKLEDGSWILISMDQEQFFKETLS